MVKYAPLQPKKSRFEIQHSKKFVIDDEIEEPLVPESTSQNLKTADTQIFTNQNPEKDEKFELQNLQRINPIFKKRSSNKSNLDIAGR